MITPLTVPDAILTRDTPDRQPSFSFRLGGGAGVDAEGARHQRGQALLADRSRPVDEVAWLCGYSDASAFGKAFRRAIGVTPGEWRNTPPRLI